MRIFRTPVNTAYLDVLIYIGLFIYGFAQNYQFAWRANAINLPDGGLVSDAAWRISQGQVPFEDFGMIQGAGAALLEAPFILMFGHSLSSLIIHVSCVNGAAAVLTYFLLRTLKAERYVAVIFSIFTANIFYAPLGMSFSVQHGGFYTLAALAIGVWGEWSRPNTSLRIAVWIFCGALLGMAALSKVTIGFYFPAFLALLFIDWRNTAVKKIIFVSIGFFLPVMLILLMAKDALYTLQGIWDYIIVIPNQYGGHRLKGGLSDALKIYEMTVTPTVLLTFGLFFASLAYWWKSRQPIVKPLGSNLAGSANAYMLIVLLGGLLQLGCVYVATIHHFGIRTMEQLVFVAAAIVYTGLVQLVIARDAEKTDTGIRTAHLTNTAFVYALSLAMIFVSGFDSWWNYRNANKNGGFRDIGSAYYANVDVPKELIFPEIEGMKFREFHVRYTAESIIDSKQIIDRLTRDNAIVAALKERSENVFLVGFEFVFYMFANKPSPLPVISVQPGASSPHFSSPIYAKTIAQLKKNFIRYDIQSAFIEINDYKTHAEYIASYPNTFCSVTEHSYYYEVRFCEVSKRPADWPEMMGHLVYLDGPFYGDAGLHK